jgi:hypothetical protein
MIAVIQCAARKRPDAGYLRTSQGKPVLFVADPSRAPASEACAFARPDDLSDTGATWRQVLLQYNADPGNNHLGLSPAYQLYGNPAYRGLADRLGIARTYILSAGWGLISAAFLTPQYDITFSQDAKRKAPYKYRRQQDTYHDLNQLPDSTGDLVVFFDGRDYVPLFCSLTRVLEAPRLLFYNSEQPPEAPGCSLERYRTATRTNWHYECVTAFLDGRLQLP